MKEKGKKGPLFLEEDNYRCECIAHINSLGDSHRNNEEFLLINGNFCEQFFVLIKKKAIFGLKNRFFTLNFSENRCRTLHECVD